MRDQLDHLKDLDRDRQAARPDRSELASIWGHAGTPDGFSMEWLLDRTAHPVEGLNI